MNKTPLHIDRKWLYKIENVLPRLKWSISPLKVIQWLENFENNDREIAFDFLLAIEYVHFPELQYRLDDQLNKITEGLDPHSNVLIVPYGKFGKSGTLLTYPLRNTDSFKNLKKRAVLSVDFTALKVEKDSCLIMLDDFIGSGNTFLKEYQTAIKPWADSNNIEKRFLLTAFTMKEAAKKLSDLYPTEVRIFSETRFKAFDPIKSPFGVFGTLQKLEAINSVYGSRLNCFPSTPFCRPLGYENSESLISFFYGTPNNTLPIIWASSKWKALFPRASSTKMSEARKLKREVAFYIGIMNRLGIDLYENRSIKINGKRQRKYNHKTDHSLLLVLRLKLSLTDDILIAQILGITMKELEDIIGYGRRKNYFDGTGLVTSDGTQFFKNLMAHVKKKSFRSSNEENFRMKNIAYLPKVFKGVT